MRRRRPSLSSRSMISICSPSVGRSNFATSEMVALTSTLRGCSGWRRAKASRCWINSVQRCAAWSIRDAVCCSAGLSARAGHQRLGGAGDDGEHVVEVMRDAAGELSDRVELLRLLQLALGFARGGDVVVDQRRAADRARGVAQRAAGDHEMGLAVAAAGPGDQLEIVELLAAQRRASPASLPARSGVTPSAWKAVLSARSLVTFMPGR